MIKNKYYSQILFILIVIISVQTSIANITSYDIDSFDSLKLNKYIDSVTTYISVKPDNAKPFIDSLLVYSTDYQNDYGLFKSYNFLGIYYWMYRDYDSAIYNYRRAMGYSDMTSDARNKALVM